jgi:hypothetical protein
MSPDQIRIKELESKVTTLEQKLDSFLSVAELDPQIIRTVEQITEVTKIDSVGNTSSILKSVNEGGTQVFNVAEEYAGSIIFQDPTGAQYKVGYYNA